MGFREHVNSSVDLYYETYISGKSTFLKTHTEFRVPKVVKINIHIRKKYISETTHWTSCRRDSWEWRDVKMIRQRQQGKIEIEQQNSKPYLRLWTIEEGAVEGPGNWPSDSRVKGVRRKGRVLALSDMNFHLRNIFIWRIFRRVNMYKCHYVPNYWTVEYAEDDIHFNNENF